VCVCVCADTLPYSIRYLLESAIRNCDNFQVLKADVEKILDWEQTAPKQVEIPFKPARVILQVCYLFHISEFLNFLRCRCVRVMCAGEICFHDYAGLFELQLTMLVVVNIFG